LVQFGNFSKIIRFVLKNSKYSFRYSNTVEIPRIKTTTYGRNSFKYTTAVLWNDLPDDFRKIAKLNQFKNILLLYPFVYKAKTARHRNNLWKGQVCWRF
jgi:hypothetical protein